MNSLLGWNVEGTFTDKHEWARLLEICKRTRPTAMLIISNPSRAAELRNALPATEIIYRQHIEREETEWPKISPAQWYAYTAEQARAGFTVHSPNEPGPLTDQLYQWLMEYARICVQNKKRAVIGNFSVGMPHETSWARYPQLLDYIAANRQYLRLGLHEYAPHLMSAEYTLDPRPSAWPRVPADSKPYLVGRYRWIPRDVPIIFTEFGWDTIPSAPFNAWQWTLEGMRERAGYRVAAAWWATVDRQGLTVQQYAARQIKWAFDQFCRNDPRVKGACFFTWGNQGDWREFYNVSDQEEFQETLMGFDLSSTAQTVNYEIRNQGTRLTRARMTGVAAVNLRSVPTTTANNPVGLIREGETVEYYADSEAVNFVSGREAWRWHRTAGNTWFALVDGLVLQNTDSAKAQLVERLNAAANAIDAALAVANTLPE